MLGTSKNLTDLLSIILGIILPVATEFLFKSIMKLCSNKNHKNLIIFLFFTQIIKMTFFMISLFLCLKFLQIQPKLFIVSVLTYLTVNFMKNLLKLLLWKAQI